MHDWIFEARAELLMMALPEQPWSSDQGATSWFSPGPANDFETWLPDPEPKGDLGDFSLLFNEPAAELDDVVTTARRVEGFPTAVQVGFDNGSGVGEPPGAETGGSGGGEPQTTEPDCQDVNEVGLANSVPVPDGAKYYLPEGVTQKYLDDALAHLKSFDPVNNLLGLMNEFREMYRDATHAHFLDFKRWDTAHPDEANPTVTYWSDAEGGWVSPSAFEAFGNFIYGAFGTIAGIPAEVLKAAAGWTQEGGSGGLVNQFFGAVFFADDAMDKPHVQLGIQAGDLYKYSGQPIATPVVGGSCGSGGDGSGGGSGETADTAGSGGGDPGGYTPPTDDGSTYSTP